MRLYQILAYATFGLLWLGLDLDSERCSPFLIDAPQDFSAHDPVPQRGSGNRDLRCSDPKSHTRAGGGQAGRLTVSQQQWMLTTRVELIPVCSDGLGSKRAL